MLIRSNIEEEIIAKINAHTVLTNFNIKSCHTNDPKVEVFHKFRKNDPQNVFLQADKSKDVIYIPRKVNHQKLSELFSDRSKFEPKVDLEISEEVTKFYSMLNDTIKKNLSTKTVKKIAPKHSIMDCYGTVKMHKNISLRPI